MDKKGTIGGINTATQTRGLWPNLAKTYEEGLEDISWGKINPSVGPPILRASLPTDPKERKATPIWSGVIKYFPDALAAIARVSQVGNDQHNPGEPLHWARGKSMDQMDCAVRHMIDHTKNPIDTDGTLHLAKAAWRVLAELQLYIEGQDESP